MKKIIEWIRNIMTSPCPKCKTGRVSHSHSEPMRITTIEVYECNNCKEQFV